MIGTYDPRPAFFAADAVHSTPCVFEIIDQQNESAKRGLFFRWRDDVYIGLTAKDTSKSSCENGASKEDGGTLVKLVTSIPTGQEEVETGEKTW